jgi:short-subunit dehydrogenase
MTGSRPLAVVTGAAGGIGLELAMQLAERGFDLVVAAEDDARLRQAAQLIRASGAAVQAVRADLRDYDETERLHAAVTASGRPVAVAALNVGIGKGGPFVVDELADELSIVDLDVRSTVRPAKRLLPDMTAMDEGRILITSSIASTAPGSFQAVCNAWKSFLQSFAQALRDELRDTGVTVTALMPGPTETDFFRRAGMGGALVGRQEKDDPAQVAKQGLDALMAGADKIVAGSAKTRATGLVSRVIPDRLKAAAHRSMAEPGSGERQRDAEEEA